MMQFLSTNKNRRRHEGGFNLVEIVIATGIISISLVSIVVIAGRSIVISHRSLDTYQASIALEEGVEALRSIRDNAWSNISSLTVGTTYYPAFSSATNTWGLTTTATDGTDGMFSRSVVVQEVNRDGLDAVTDIGTPDSGTRLVTVTVSWMEGGTPVTKNVSFTLSDIFS